MTPEGARRRVSGGAFLVQLATLGGIFLVFIIFVVAIDLPAGRRTQAMLRALYAPHPIALSTLKTDNGLGSCGWYGVDGQAWRYLNTREGLWAEGLSKEWQSQSQAAADLQDRWSYCMTRTGRGHRVDWLSDPIAVVYLNAT